MRSRIPVLVVTAAVLAAVLTGCTPSGNDASCKVTSGKASDSVTASGDFDGSVTAKVPSPLTVKTTQRSTLIQGDGQKLQKDQYAHFALTIYDGGTGTAVQNLSTYAAVSTGSLQVKGLVNALQCVSAGSRVAIVVPPSQGASTLGASTGSSAVVIADVSKPFPTRATGSPRPGKPGFPTVVLAPNGQPGMTIPADQPAPKKIASETLKQGHGAKLTAKDTVVVNYTSVSWNNPTVQDSSWKQGNPATVALGGTDPISKLLLGKQVGSQLVMNVPAADNNGTAVVYVFDLLGAYPTPPDASAQG